MVTRAQETKRLQEMLRGGPLDLPFVAGVFDRHPGVQKRLALGKTILKYAVANDGFPGKPKNCFWAYWSDGEVARMSIKTAVAGEYRTPLMLFTMAARAAIEPQIREFREACTDCVCGISGEPIEGRATDVDHAYPKTFSFLRDEFIRETGLRLEEVQLRDADGKPCIVHPTIHNMWTWFHGKHAVLRLTLSTENRRLGNRPCAV